jgi:hypothetical protein
MIRVAMIGNPADIASMSTTGRPSLKLARQKTSAAA